MFGERLKQARNGRNYTQQELADKVDDHRVNIAGYESGVKTPSLAVAVRIADELDVSMDWLLNRKEHCNGCQMDKDCH